MKIYKKEKQEADKLTLFFSGWSAPPQIADGLSAGADTDIWICYDYRDLSFDASVEDYKEVRIAAWSLGVWVAETVWRDLEEKGIHIKDAIAINGTPRPIDNLFGIPEATFDATVDNLTEEGIRRFNRRMCGDKDTLSNYLALPSRPYDEIADELRTLYFLIRNKRVRDMSFPWSKAIVSQDDLIFPAKNQSGYWIGRCPVTNIQTSHYPFDKWNNWDDIMK